MTSAYRTEREMYGPVQGWLNRFLTSRFKHSQIRVYDTSNTKLSTLIDRYDLSSGLSPDWPTWEIQIDIVGFVHELKATHLAFVECKNTSLSLDHLAQLLGYSRVARPTHAFLISPQGPNSSLTQLLKTHQRLDVLEYTQDKNALPRSLIIARWDSNANTIAMDSVITSSIQKVELTKF
jgi:hypothetical protein